jgi:hypothetical protein
VLAAHLLRDLGEHRRKTRDTDFVVCVKGVSDAGREQGDKSEKRGSYAHRDGENNANTVDATQLHLRRVALAGLRRRTYEMAMIPSRQAFAVLSLTMLLLTFLGAPGHAELRWSDPIQSIHSTPEDREVTARFAFRNAGPTPVTVRSIKTTCGCTTARLEKKTYAPGETGEIDVRFVFGGRKGLQRKLITVKTDDSTEPAILDLRVLVEENVTVTPALVYWRLGEANTPKTVHVTANSTPVSIKGVVSENNEWRAEVATIKPGEDYLVRIQPPATTAKSGTTIRIVTAVPNDEPRSYVVYGRVK